MYTVYDGARTLRFEGTLLSSSSSRTKRKFRWIEFELYKTTKGRYVLSRTGFSLYYHQESCHVVARNGIEAVPAQTVSINLIPCESCRPDRETDDELYPESARHWAQALDTADGVLSSLKKYDDHGAEYLTDVAKRLLERAAQNDEDINQSFFDEYID